MFSMLNDFDKIFETAKILTFALFAGFAAWELVVAVDEQTIISLLEILAAILRPIIGPELAIAVPSLAVGAVAGLPALLRRLKKQKLMKVEAE